MAKQSATKKRPRRVIVLSDDDEDLNADEEDVSEDHMGEDEGMFCNILQLYDTLHT